MDGSLRMQHLNQDHENALKVLKGLRLTKIGRSADLLWASFGKLRLIEDHRGRRREIGEWALHIQEAPYRIVRDRTILIGSTDMHREPDTGDWLEDHPDIGDCRFDKLAAKLNVDLVSKTHVVESIKCDGLGGFNLIFNNGMQYDVFTSTSPGVPECELWRLFRPYSETDHFVVVTHPTTEQ